MMRHEKCDVRLVTIFLLGFATAANAQVSEEWSRRYDSSAHSNDYGTRTVVDSAGNIIVTGESAGGWTTIKYGPAGDTLFTASDPYATSGRPLALTVDRAGAIYVAGYHYTGWVATGNQYVTMKYSPAGVRQWLAVYDGRGGPTDDFPRAIALDDSGNVYVTGDSEGPYRQGIATIKYTKNGARSSSWPDIGWGVGVRRYDVAGQTGLQRGVAIAVDRDQNVYVAGISAPYASGPGDYVTIKYDAAGTEVWTRRYDGPAASEDSPVAVALDDSANVYVAGTSYGPNQNGQSRGDFATVKYSPGGALQWVARFNGPANYEDRCADMVMDASGDFYVTGTAWNASPDFATIRYHRNGQPVWVAWHDGPDHADEQARAIAVGGDGCVYVTGSSATATGSLDYETVKYDALGNEAWRIGYGGPALGSDVPASIAVDATGHVYVHGSSVSPTNWNDYLTLRYSQPLAAVAESGGDEARLILRGPNPFRSGTTIEFTLDREQSVTLSVLDLSGRAVARLADGVLSGGTHRCDFDARALARGVYFVRLRAGQATLTRKIVRLGR